jgi:hypothetical protein
MYIFRDCRMTSLTHRIKLVAADFSVERSYEMKYSFQFAWNIKGKLHLIKVYYLFSAGSNPTNVVLVIVLSMIIGKDA